MTRHVDENHFLAVRLQGTESNRDAIGARVEVVLDEPSAARQIRTLRAGDGYLSQSSKWLHFGLGRAPAIKQLTIRWPSGQTQHFEDLAANRRYVIREGDGQPALWAAGPAAPPSAAQPDATSPAVDRARIVLANPLPLPRFTYRSADGSSVALDDVRRERRVTLVNLWASWCQPCLDELQQLATRIEDLRAADVEVDCAQSR